MANMMAAKDFTPWSNLTPTRCGDLLLK